MVRPHSPCAADRPPRLAQVGEDGAELGAVAHGVQVALEGGFAADAHGLARSPPGCRPGPRQRGAATHRWILPNCATSHCGSCAASSPMVNARAPPAFVGLGADAVDLAHVQRPDQRLQVGLVNDGNAVGLGTRSPSWPAAGWRHANGAGQPGAFKMLFWMRRPARACLRAGRRAHR